MYSYYVVGIPKQGRRIVMKNLPDKIYLNLGEFSKEEFDETDFQDLSEVTWSEDDLQGMNEEYVRKDAFIEKVARFLEYKLNDRVEIRVAGTLIPSLTDKKTFVEDFKKYMEDGL